jgi:hypothetical protein
MYNDPLTPEQNEALEAMEKAFGPTDAMLHNVTDDSLVNAEFGYAHWIRRSAKDTLRMWGQLKYAMTLEEEVS